MLHCKPAKSIINNSRSHWFSKANTLVWAEPCARWAELRMLSFWAGGISSFPLVPANTACYAGYEISSFLSSRVCLSVPQIFQNFESSYNILNILTQLIQTSCLVTQFCAQTVFKLPFSNTFPTHKTI